MENKTEGINWGGCMMAVFENAVYFLGLALMFSKTVDLMSAFAPRVFLGYTDIEGIYGVLVGVMNEGALVVMKFMLGRPKNVMEWAWNVILLVTPFIISAIAQVFDSMIIRQTLDQQPEELQFFATWFIPSIPSVIVGMFIVRAILRSIPQEMLASIAKGYTDAKTKQPVVETPVSWSGLVPQPSANADPTPASIKPKSKI